MSIIFYELAIQLNSFKAQLVLFTLIFLVSIEFFSAVFYLKQLSSLKEDLIRFLDLRHKIVRFANFDWSHEKYI